MAYTAASGIDEDMDGEDVEDSDEEGDMFTSAFQLLTRRKLMRDRPNRSPPASDMSGSFWASRTTRPTSLEMSHSQNPRAAFQRRHTTSTVGSFSTASGDNAPSHPPVYTLPGFPVLQDVTALIQHVPYENVQTFWSAFCHHLDILVGCVRGLHFDRYELNVCHPYQNCSVLTSSAGPSGLHCRPRALKPPKTPPYQRASPLPLPSPTT